MWSESLNFTTIAILSALFGGGANILVKRVVRDVRPEHALAPGFLFIAVALAIFSPWFYHFNFSLSALTALGLVVAIDGLANYFYFKSFVNSEVSIVIPLLSAAPAITFFFGWLLLGENVSVYKLVIALGIILLLVIFSVDRKQFIEFKKETLVPALASAILFGASAIPAKYLLTTLSATNAPTLYMFRAAIIGSALLFVYRQTFLVFTKNQYYRIFTQASAALVQWILLYTALGRGGSGITITLVNTVPVFTFILGILFLKEKVTLKKVVATALILGLLVV